MCILKGRAEEREGIFSAIAVLSAGAAQEPMTVFFPLKSKSVIFFFLHSVRVKELVITVDDL